MAGNRVKVSRPDFITDIRAGLYDSDLMTKYGLSATQLAKLFDKLIDAGFLTRHELDAREAYLARKKAPEKDENVWTITVEPDGDSNGEPRFSGTDKSTSDHATRITPDDLRVDGEMTILYVTLAAVGLALLFLVGISLGTVLILVAIIAAMIKIRQGQLLGNSIKVSEHQLTEIYKLAKEAALRLDMRLPEVFVTQNPVINAYAIGFLGKKSVVLHSATAESMTSEELRSIIGHELTHIKCDHTTWLALTSVKDQVHIPLVSDVLGFIFLYWSRKAEYTSDRGGLIASGDLVASVSALAKLAVGKELFAKMNIDHLLHQLHELDEDDVAKLTELFATHPYIVRRIQALRSFYQSDSYRKLSS